MPIVVTICRGVTCSRLSSATIQAVVEKLARQHQGLLQVQIQNCFARCQENRPGLCPSIRINDEWMHNADEINVKRKLRPMLEKLEAELSDPDNPFNQMLRDHPPSS